MIDAAAGFGHGEEIQEGPCGVGDGHFHGAAPEGL
jgi:hypothetical protein